MCRYKHGAIVVKSGNIITRATNARRNIPANVPSNRSVHAEVAALRSLGSPGIRTPKLVLYVARVGKSGEPRLSRPCNECWEFIRSYNVREVIYTTGKN